MCRDEIVSFVRNVPNGRMIGIEWIKADGSVRKGSCCFGVQHPTHVTAPGQGIRQGVGFNEAVQNCVLKFFDVNAEAKNGGKGAYRSARLDRIISLAYDGKRHIIEDNQHLLNEI